jgi:hypothetical protein
LPIEGRPATRNKSPRCNPQVEAVNCRPWQRNSGAASDGIHEITQAAGGCHNVARVKPFPVLAPTVRELRKHRLGIANDLLCAIARRHTAIYQALRGEDCPPQS